MPRRKAAMKLVHSSPSTEQKEVDDDIIYTLDFTLHSPVSDMGMEPDDYVTDIDGTILAHEEGDKGVPVGRVRAFRAYLGDALEAEVSFHDVLDAHSQE